jgi:hypothetical protein
MLLSSFAAGSPPAQRASQAIGPHRFGDERRQQGDQRPDCAVQRQIDRAVAMSFRPVRQMP